MSFLAASSGYVWCAILLLAEPGAASATDGASPAAGSTQTRPGEADEGVNVWELFDAGRFDDLEDLAREFRQGKKRYDDGGWYLSDFYQVLVSRCGKMTEAEESTFYGAMGRWEQAHPSSVTRLVALAHANIQFAWRERGSRRGRDVVFSQWARFEKYLKRAQDAVIEAERRAEKDPDLYVAKLTIIRGWGGWPTDGAPGADPAEAAFQAGVALEPEYYRLYTDRAVDLLPRWGGSPEAVLAFAERSVQATAPREGTGLYARIAWTVLRWEGWEEFQTSYGFSWPRLRRAYEDILERFPQSVPHKNQLCRFACLYGDRETARTLFARIGGDVIPELWANEIEARNWKAWAADETGKSTPLEMEAAVKAGNTADVRRLLAEGADPNGTTMSGSPFLILALAERQDGAVKALLAAGADPNRPSETGTTPLKVASQTEGPADGLALLLEHRADPNARNKDGWPPLSAALDRRQLDKALLLLEHGADVHAQTKDGFAPLHFAALRGLAGAIPALIEKGADPNQPNNEGVPPLHYAVAAGDLETCRALLKRGARVDLEGMHGKTPLLEAVRQGNLPLTRLLVESGADPNRADGEGWNAFLLATAEGRLAVLKYLAEKSPEGLRYVRPEKERTLVHQAAKYGRVDVLRFLLDRGLAINPRDAGGATPLALAEEGKHAAAAALLRERGGKR